MPEGYSIKKGPDREPDYYLTKLGENLSREEIEEIILELEESKSKAEEKGDDSASLDWGNMILYFKHKLESMAD